MEPEFPEYLADRVPVTPPSLLINDRILVVHTENEPDEVVDLWVTGREETREDGGSTVITITWRDDEANVGTREFTNPRQWLSVAFPRHNAPVAVEQASAA